MHKFREILGRKLGLKKNKNMQNSNFGGFFTQDYGQTTVRNSLKFNTLLSLVSSTCMLKPMYLADFCFFLYFFFIFVFF